MKQQWNMCLAIFTRIGSRRAKSVVQILSDFENPGVLALYQVNPPVGRIPTPDKDLVIFGAVVGGICRCIDGQERRDEKRDAYPDIEEQFALERKNRDRCKQEESGDQNKSPPKSSPQ